MNLNATTPPVGAEIVRQLGALVRDEAATTELGRTLSPALVAALRDRGLANYMNPVEAGGREPSIAEIIATWEAAAALDGSFGWTCLANFSSTMAAAAYLPERGFAEVFGRPTATMIGGQYAPNGRGRRTDGGILLSGSWNFGSGTGHADYIAAGYIPEPDPDHPAEGFDFLRIAVVPRDQVTFTDGWHVQGLRGTGSYDYQMTDVFVPEHRTFPLLTRTPRRGAAPVYRLGLLAITAAGHAAWALGVARSMLDDVEELARTRVRMGDSSTLAHRDSFQRGLAHHRMLWRAAHLLVLDTATAAEQAVTERGVTEHALAEHAVDQAVAGHAVDQAVDRATSPGLTPATRATVRAAAVFATEAGHQIAEWAHLAAGTAAIRDGSRLERAFRDMYTGTQHVFINPKVAGEAAQIWLGLVDDHPAL